MNDTKFQEPTFEERMVTQELTREFIEHGTKIDTEGEAIKRVSELVVWFERNHNAVAQAERSREYAGGYSITITVIAGIDSDIDMIKRGLEELQHRLYRESQDHK